MIDQSIAFWLALTAIGSFAGVLWYYRTVLFGFTCLAFFSIASASFAAFIFGYGFSLSEYWVTTEHLWVITYTAGGLIAFSFGVALGWRPLHRLWQIEASSVIGNVAGPSHSFRVVPTAPSKIALARMPWLNPQLALLCVGLGAAAYLATPVFFLLPTIRAFTSAFYGFLQFGLLIALIYGRVTHRYRLFLVCFSVFVILVLSNAVATGHIGAGGLFLIQLMLVGCLWPRPTLRAATIFLVGMIVMSGLIAGWLDSRHIIRSGQLTQYNTAERISKFAQEFVFVNPFTMTPKDFQNMLFDRVDMTSILTAQVRHQPQFKAYEYGKAILDDLSVAIVPRFLWQDKSVIVGGSEFVTRYTGLAFAKGTSVGLPYQFELYANGGAVLVVVGLFLLGWLTARLELSLFTASHSLTSFLILLMALNTIMRSEQTFITQIMSLLAGVFGAFALSKILAFLKLDRRFWQQADERNNNTMAAQVTAQLSPE